MSEYALMHYGVKGMKWGQRRAERRNKEGDRRLRAIDLGRKIDKLNYEHTKKELEIRKAEPKKVLPKFRNALLNQQIANAASDYKSKVTLSNYHTAKAKAYKDKSYKDTAEYNKAIKEGRLEIGRIYADNLMKNMLYGA